MFVLLDGQLQARLYILADPLIQHLSIEQILSDGVVFKYKDNFLTIEEIGNEAFNKI